MKRESHLTRGRFVRVIALLAVLLVGSLLAAATIGSVHIDVMRALDGAIVDNVDRVILLQTRVPRVLMAAIVGAALATAGVALQGLLRNPLAEPHLIGVSGGAALGAVIAILAMGRSIDGGAYFLPLAASLGALASMGIVYRLSLVRGKLQPYQLLLSGVVYNAFAGALIMCANAVADFLQAQGLLFWLLGSLANHGYGMVASVGAYILASAIWLLRYTPELNLLSLGDEPAMQLGVDVERVRRIVFVASSLLVGAVVAVSGMIGFVGLIVPHVMRLLLGADHRLLLPASFLSGAIFLVWADTLARTALGAVEIPVGVVTALCGGPFFISLLRRQGRRFFLN